MYREWIVSLGRRPAYTRIAHVLCEIMVRLEAVGLTQNGSCRLPLTQVELSDALGLSSRAGIAERASAQPMIGVTGSAHHTDSRCRTASSVMTMLGDPCRMMRPFSMT